jgi:hypothetical protein
MIKNSTNATEFKSEFFADLRNKHTKHTTCPVFGLESAGVKDASINSTSTPSFAFDADEVW